MLNSFNVYNKHKVRPRNINKTYYQRKDNFNYMRDFYLKDFQYISPQSVGANKNEQRRNYTKNMGRNHSCRMFAKLWLVEVMKGLKQFLYEGSLHGVKYIFEPTFTRKERLTWVVIVVISVAFCAVNIIQLFSKWTSTPFVNIIDSLPTPMWAIPFPTVAFCPHVHIKKSYANVSQLTSLQRFFAGLVCPQMKKEQIRLKNRMTENETKMLLEFINKGSLACKDVVQACYWRPFKGTDWFEEDCCEKLFTPMMTYYGMCFTFNSLPLNGFNNDSIEWIKSFDPDVKHRAFEWDLDLGYPQNFYHDDNILPRRTRVSGESYGLGVKLYLNKSEHQFGCDGNDFGFTVLIKSPADHMYTSTVIRLPMNQMTSIELVPTTFKTDHSLRSLKPNVRQCYFQDEKKLKHFLFYTGANCKQDYYMHQSRIVCKCMLYNWPRIYSSDAVCTTESDYECVQNVRAGLEEQLMNAFYIDSNEGSKHDYSSTTRYSCYPSCNDIFYDNQVFYSNLMERTRTGTTSDNSEGNEEMTQLNVHFRDNMFLGQHRHAQYDDYYFAGAIGGLLSLFLGFSIISVAELVYFVILRPIRIAFVTVYALD